jgi:hypothetical protein
MGGMRDHVARGNIERYGRLLRQETDPVKLRILARLLDDARAELQYPLSTTEPAGPGGVRPVPTGDEAHRWRLKSEECQTIAESCLSESARDTFLRLARSYASLAQRAEHRELGEPPSKSAS